MCVGVRTKLEVTTEEGVVATASIEQRMFLPGDVEHMVWEIEGTPRNRVRVERLDSADASAGNPVQPHPDIITAPDVAAEVAELELELRCSPLSDGAARALFGDGFGFEARVFEGDGTAVVAVVGEIDMATAGLLQQAIDDACTSSTQVVIDLTDTAFIDSTGLAVFMRAHAQLGSQPDALVLRGAGPRVARIFEIAGLDHLVTTTWP